MQNGVQNMKTTLKLMNGITSRLQGIEIIGNSDERVYIIIKELSSTKVTINRIYNGEVILYPLV